MKARGTTTKVLALALCLSVPAVSWADQNSSDSHSDRSSDNSESGGESHTITVVLVLSAVAVYGAMSVSAFNSLKATSDSDKEKAARALSQYLRENHGSVTRDVLAARGSFFETWQSESGMTQAEASRFQAYFNGSSQQTAMVHALNSDLSVTEARAFASEMMQAAHHVFGQERFDTIVAASIAHHQAHQAGVR